MEEAREILIAISKWENRRSLIFVMFGGLCIISL